MGKHQLVIDLTIRFASDFAIVGASGSGLLDDYVIKDTYQRPYIPASSLRGKVRHQLSQLLTSCNPDRFCGYEGEEEDCSCMICTLFGCEGNHRGSLLFDNLTVDQEDLLHSNYYQKRTGISISRHTRTVRDQALRSYETSGSSGALAFSGSITGYVQGEDWQQQVVWLYLALKMVQSLGKSQSAGLGTIHPDSLISLMVDGAQVDMETLRKWGVTDAS